MINTLKTVTALQGRTRFARRPLTVSTLLSAINYKYVLSTIIACSIVSLVATIAYSQELPVAATESGAPGDASGWWSPEQSHSEVVPRLVISMAEPV